MSHPSPEACAACPAHHLTNLRSSAWTWPATTIVVALAGNPNTGKSTVFNALTGLRQHTGNWPGKTVTRAEGAFATGGHRYKLVDLPGTYSLLSASLDEEVARDFILFGQPDVTVIVVDATTLERNLNLVLQVLEITNRAVVCLNLMDEARRRGLEVDPRRLARDLGVRVVATAARQGEGLPELMQAIAEVANGAAVGTPHRARRPLVAGAAAGGDAGERGGARPLSRAAQRGVGGAAPARRRRAHPDGAALGRARRTAPAHRSRRARRRRRRRPIPQAADAVVELASQLRWQVGTEFHQSLMEALYTEAARIADRAVTRAGGARRFDLDRTIDRLVTSRRLGRAADDRDADRRVLADHRRRQRAVGHAGHAAHRLDGAGAQVGRRGDRRCRGGSRASSSTACTWPRPGW